MHSKSGIIRFLSFHFEKYSIFRDVDIKNCVAINFHKKIYADEITNQRLFKPMQIQVAFDVVNTIEHRRGLELHCASESLKNFISQCLQKEQQEVYFFAADQIEENL